MFINKNWEEAQRIANIRTTIHRGHKSQRILVKDHDTYGVLGEMKFSKITKLPIDENGYLQGDGGIDFECPQVGFIDVKTSTRLDFLLIEKGKCKENVIYVLAEVNHQTNDIDLMGWEYGSEMIKIRPYAFPKNIINHVKRDIQLKDLEKLWEMMKVKTEKYSAFF